MKKLTLKDELTKFLLYTVPNAEVRVETIMYDENIWLPQKRIAELFGVQRPAITKHLKNIFEVNELEEDSVCSILEHTAEDGKNYQTKYYNLDAILAVGYRVNSKQATQFRIWATKILKEYIIKGFALNDERFKSGNSMNYFNELQTRLREIRISERFFYQKIKDIYTTSIDYNAKDENSIAFFKIIQNKLLWAISSQTAAELIYRRADATLPLMGMLSFDKENSARIRKSEVSIAKNYLNEDEIKLLGLLVEQYLAFAETMAQQHTPMYMKDWTQKLDNIISLNGRELLTHAGKISREIADEKSHLEYEKYKQKQESIKRQESFNELEADMKKLLK